MMHRVILGLGGNQGDRLSLIREALDRLLRKMVLLRSSGVYETEAWGGNSQEAYLNQVLALQTEMDPLTTLRFLQQVEHALGRRRGDKWGDRTMDIDILYFDDRLIDTDTLQVPHPQLPFRKFVLVPLTEILPDFLHPALQVSNRDLLAACRDPLSVRLYAGS
ncbi:2-amino-4-hydroxy-6-hydroxymethyldihydropteridine diphosphokinase [Cyclobacterium xiamenense]|uniref:2-amino-4-hydroxy-6- hydroxymethyldihydropteridine diphosphokinase n=1 Tax=Cyclobacterium xiamenense TaxID=1297121 RepID=UPI0035CF6091